LLLRLVVKLLLAVAAGLPLRGLINAILPLQLDLLLLLAQRYRLIAAIVYAAVARLPHSVHVPVAAQAQPAALPM
jgi:hypothetical protein